MVRKVKNAESQTLKSEVGLACRECDGGPQTVSP
jgi:hypothetical protein